MPDRMTKSIDAVIAVIIFSRHNYFENEALRQVHFVASLTVPYTLHAIAQITLFDAVANYYTRWMFTKVLPLPAPPPPLSITPNTVLVVSRMSSYAQCCTETKDDRLPR